jgi:hypothetical protein
VLWNVKDSWLLASVKSDDNLQNHLHLKRTSQPNTNSVRWCVENLRLVEE